MFWYWLKDGPKSRRGFGRQSIVKYYTELVCIKNRIINLERR